MVACHTAVAKGEANCGGGGGFEKASKIQFNSSEITVIYTYIL